MAFISISKEHVRSARAYLQIKQSTFAKIVGVSDTTIQKIESGYGIITCKSSTADSIRSAFEERGIVFKLTDKGFPYIEYDPDKDVIGYLKDKK